MTSQTSTVVNLFAARSVNLRQRHSISEVHAKSNRLNDIPLQNGSLQNKPTAKALAYKKFNSWLTSLLVLLAHIVVIYALMTQNPSEKIQKPSAKPMLVSLIALPAAEPEIVPIIEPPKPIIKPKPIVKPVIKKVVEKIQPIEAPVEKLVEEPAERLVEAAVEQPVIEDQSIAQAAPVQIAEAVKAPPKSEAIVEEKIEPPRFGVSYLNNPPPDYPAMSRRIGEEGRVLMKVLVSTEGTAQEVQIETTSGSNRLDQAAMNAVKQWRFIPAKKNNQPLSAYVLVPMKFSLNS